MTLSTSSVHVHAMIPDSPIQWAVRILRRKDQLVQHPGFLQRSRCNEQPAFFRDQATPHGVVNFAGWRLVHPTEIQYRSLISLWRRRVTLKRKLGPSDEAPFRLNAQRVLARRAFQHVRRHELFQLRHKVLRDADLESLTASQDPLAAHTVLLPATFATQCQRRDAKTLPQRSRHAYRGLAELVAAKQRHRLVFVLQPRTLIRMRREMQVGALLLEVIHLVGHVLDQSSKLLGGHLAEVWLDLLCRCLLLRGGFLFLRH